MTRTASLFVALSLTLTACAPEDERASDDGFGAWADSLTAAEAAQAIEILEEQASLRAAGGPVDHDAMLETVRELAELGDPSQAQRLSDWTDELEREPVWRGTECDDAATSANSGWYYLSKAERYAKLGKDEATDAYYRRDITSAQRNTGWDAYSEAYWALDKGLKAKNLTAAVAWGADYSCSAGTDEYCATIYTDSAYDQAWDSWNANLLAYISTGIGDFETAMSRTNTAISYLWDAREDAATCYIDS